MASNNNPTTITDRERITRMEEKLDSIHVALLGSKITEDGGMVGRLRSMEERVDDLETEINRYKWALMGILAVVPIVITAIIFILKQFNIVKV